MYLRTETDSRAVEGSSLLLRTELTETEDSPMVLTGGGGKTILSCSADDEDSTIDVLKMLKMINKCERSPLYVADVSAMDK